MVVILNNRLESYDTSPLLLLNQSEFFNHCSVPGAKILIHDDSLSKIDSFYHSFMWSNFTADNDTKQILNKSDMVLTKFDSESMGVNSSVVYQFTKAHLISSPTLRSFSEKMQRVQKKLEDRFPADRFLMQFNFNPVKSGGFAKQVHAYAYL